MSAIETIIILFISIAFILGLMKLLKLFNK